MDGQSRTSALSVLQRLNAMENSVFEFMDHHSPSSVSSSIAPSPGDHANSSRKYYRKAAHRLVSSYPVCVLYVLLLHIAKCSLYKYHTVAPADSYKLQ
uniref:Uncharacterized protein n=1 Tax=Timema shepardi TaxID=629360 RepID=A0A7R9FY40_TIMSH|nr:unnamed protein product [Timema shepardi]